VQTFTEETDKKQVLSGSVEAYRSALSASLSAYLTESFKANKAALAVYGADNGVLTVAISARNVNLGNFWTGAWRGVYTLTVAPQQGGGTTELRGGVKVSVHYFEDGNVQLHSNCDLNVSIVVDGAESVARKVAEAIGKFESDYQNALEEMYVNMHRTTFKAMRRLLPVNRQKFVWDAAAHSLAAQVSK
jgi:F-actin-capping protein subunit alpha